MRDHNCYGGAHLLIAFLAGAAAGAAVALMTAPKAGSETRDTLKHWAKDAQSTMERVPTALKDAYDKATVAAKEAFTESIERSKQEQADAVESEDA
jgi:gas vesicle protein